MPTSDEAILSPSVEALQKAYEDYCCKSDETAMYDRFLVVESTEGCYVRFKDDPDPYLDLVMGYSATNFGHRHPKIVEAVHRAVDSIDHVHSFNSEAKIRVSERLARMFPGHPPVRVYFPVGGAMAVENAIKISRAATGRKKIASFEGAFHGYSYGAMMVTDRAFVDLDRYAPMPGPELRLPYGNCWPCDSKDKEKVIRERLGQIDRMLAADGDVAAVILEPIQGANGFIIPEASFVRGVREITRKHGILLIDDEIQVGLGRAGRMFAITHFDVEPDLILLGKSISAGYYPTSVVMAQAALFDRINPARSGIGSTFGNNPLGLAIVDAVLHLIETEGWFRGVEEKGEALTAELYQLEKYPFVENVTGLGLAHSFAIVKDKASHTPDPERAARLQSEALRQKVLLYVAGKTKNRIKLFLPVTVTLEELRHVAMRLDELLAAIA